MSVLLAVLMGLCSVMGFVNVIALYRAKKLVGVSLLPTGFYTITNAVQAYIFISDGHPAAAISTLLCLVANALWLGLALAYWRQPRR